MPVWLGGLGGGLPLASVVSLASAPDPTATGKGVPQPVGTCAEQSAEGSHTGGTEIRPRLTRWVGTTELLSKWANNPKTVTC